MNKAIVLLSGGLDSCVAAAWAKKEFGPENCIPLNFAYGQRHARELVASEQVSEELFNVIPRTVNLSQAFYVIGGSSLTSGIRDGNPSTEAVDRTPSDLPPTFVPGRNIIMLAVAAGLMYTEKARRIVGGWNAVDYSGYPDCRAEFFDRMNWSLAAGLGLSGDILIVRAPIIRMTKPEIIRRGIELSAPLHLTWSCYSGGSEPCGTCDSCKIRIDGFAAVGIADPALSQR